MYRGGYQDDVPVITSYDDYDGEKVSTLSAAEAQRSRNSTQHLPYRHGGVKLCRYSAVAFKTQGLRSSAPNLPQGRISSAIDKVR